MSSSTRSVLLLPHVSTNVICSICIARPTTTCLRSLGVPFYQYSNRMYRMFGCPCKPVGYTTSALRTVIPCVLYPISLFIKMPKSGINILTPPLLHACYSINHNEWLVLSFVQFPLSCTSPPYLMNTRENSAFQSLMSRP